MKPCFFPHYASHICSPRDAVRALLSQAFLAANQWEVAGASDVGNVMKRANEACKKESVGGKKRVEEVEREVRKMKLVKKKSERR